MHRAAAPTDLHRRTQAFALHGVDPNGGRLADHLRVSEPLGEEHTDAGALHLGHLRRGGHVISEEPERPLRHRPDLLHVLGPNSSAPDIPPVHLDRGAFVTKLLLAAFQKLHLPKHELEFLLTIGNF